MSEVYTKCRLLLEQLDCYVTNQALSKYEIEDDIKKLESFIAEQTQALQRRVEWMTELPTRPGIYWFRKKPGGVEKFVYIKGEPDDLWVDIPDDDFIRLAMFRQWPQCQFAGPIDPPHEAHG